MLIERFDAVGVWRRDVALRLKLLAQWMAEHDLHDASWSLRLQRLESQVLKDRVTLVFAADAARGQSELINALFFAARGQRVMPGMTRKPTVCPTELSYDEANRIGLYLLPIESRLRSPTWAEWRHHLDKWHFIPLDLKDPVQVAQALATINETRQVSPEQAESLGFRSAQTTPTVEIPVWRCACVNLPHSLFKNGLVVWDMPAWEAWAAEPETLVSILPQAHAVALVLSAEPGITAEDVAIWRNLIKRDPATPPLVVLNKLDTLWDHSDTPAFREAKLTDSVARVAQTLGIPPHDVLPVTGRKAVLAKFSQDAQLLAHSGIAALDQSLSGALLDQVQVQWMQCVTDNLHDVRTDGARLLHIRKRDLADRMVELRGLQGKSAVALKSVRLRIVQEQAECEQAQAKIQAVRAVHIKLMREAMELLGAGTRKAEMAQLADTLLHQGTKLGLKRIYAHTIGRLCANTQTLQQLTLEMYAMLSATFRQLNSEYGFSLQTATPPAVDGMRPQLDRLERDHLHYLMAMGHAARLAQPKFVEHLVRSLSLRVRTLHESMWSELELWSQSALAQLDGQIHERQQHLALRLAVLDGLAHDAAHAQVQLKVMEQQAQALQAVEQKFHALTEAFLLTQDDSTDHVHLDLEVV